MSTKDPDKVLIRLAEFHGVDIRRFQYWVHNSYEMAVFRLPPHPLLETKDIRESPLWKERNHPNEGHTRRIALEIMTKMRHTKERVKMLNSFALDVKEGGARDQMIRHMLSRLDEHNVPLLYVAGFFRLRVPVASYPEYAMHQVMFSLGGQAGRAGLPDYRRMGDEWEKWLDKNKLSLLDAMVLPESPL